MCLYYLFLGESAHQIIIHIVVVIIMENCVFLYCWLFLIFCTESAMLAFYLWIQLTGRNKGTYFCVQHHEYEQLWS